MATLKYEIINSDFLSEDIKLTFDGVNLCLTVVSGKKNQTIKRVFNARFVTEICHKGIGNVGAFDRDIFNTMVIVDVTPEQKSFAIYLDEFGKLEFTAKDFSLSE